ncbi:DUF4270 family protein [Owenweeksia hongkongensis]|uniref:DUF4270 family protein n=1 Tax=Owenweeksia hongkongensis TaxID=253245 RepID=UPI003A92DB1D
MTLLNNFFRKTAILAMASLLFIGCEKPNDELGFNQVIDGVPGVADLVFDSLISYTHNQDSILVALARESQSALGGYAGNRLLGSMTDGSFGRAEASVVAQVALEENNIDFGTQPRIDSVFLYMEYNGFYGDTFKPMNYEVYQLSGGVFPNGVLLDAEGVTVDSAYYSDYIPNYATKLGELLNHKPKPNSAMVLNGDVVKAGLKIPLDTSFFRTNIIEAPSSAFENDAAFIEYFKGLYIRTVNTDGSIVYLDLNTANSGIHVYFSDRADTTNEAKRVGFNFLQSNSPLPINISIFEQDYLGAPTAFNLSMQDTVIGEDVNYAQAMGGVYTVFEIPGLDSIANKGYLINQAILEVYKAAGTGSGLTPNSRLEIRSFEGGEMQGTIKDFDAGNTLTGGGNLVSEPLRAGKYTFDITRYVFEIANGEKLTKLAITPYLKSSLANRVILAGGSNSQTPMSLKIYLTKP